MREESRSPVPVNKSVSSMKRKVLSGSRDSEAIKKSTPKTMDHSSNLANMIKELPVISNQEEAPENINNHSAIENNTQ